MEDDPKFRIGYKIFSVSDKRFNGAARWHDHAYRAGSDAQLTGMTRKEVDDRFLQHCLDLAADDWFARRRAYVYYALVRMFGGPLWEGKE